LLGPFCPDRPTPKDHGVRNAVIIGGLLGAFAALLGY
jgi:hypothetical protein